MSNSVKHQVHSHRLCTDTCLEFHGQAIRTLNGVVSRITRITLLNNLPFYEVIISRTIRTLNGVVSRITRIALLNNLPNNYP